MFPRKGALEGGITLVTLCVCALLYGAGPLVLAERGKAAEYSIVVPTTALPSQRYAAEELHDFIEKTTGVKLPIVTDAATTPAKAVAIVNSDSDGGDAFRLKVEGCRLYITGGKRGVLYGVYEVLERFAGCRWYASWHSIVPRRDRIEIPANLDEAHAPAFAMREPYWYDVIEHPEFAARLRVNSRSWKSFDEKYGGNPYRFGGGLGPPHEYQYRFPGDTLS